MAESFFRRSIIRSAWFTIWSNPALWFFGVFAAILSVGEEYDLLVRNGDVLANVTARLEQLRKAADFGLVSGFWDNLVSTVQTNLPGTLTVLITWIVAILALIWLIFVSQSALIEGVRRRNEGKPFGILDGFDIGMATFWRMFLMNLTVKAIFYGALMIVVLPLALIFFETPSVGLAVAVALWVFLILFPLTLILSFVTKFASAFIVIRGHSVRRALLEGWAMFRRHWLISVELALLILLIGFGVTYMVVTTLVVTFGFPDNASILSYLVFLGLLGFLFSWMTIFKFAAWTNLFLALEAGNAPSKLRRVIHNLLGIREKPLKAGVKA